MGKLGLEDGAYGEEEDAPEGEDGTLRRVACGVVVHKLEDGFVARANTVATYFELNRQVSPSHPRSFVRRDSPKASDSLRFLPRFNST